MSAPAAFRATFADFRLIKGRKQAQFIFEVPMESADQALEAMGGFPRGDESRWVAIARIAGQAPAEPKPVTKKRWSEMPPSQQAGLLCTDPEFQEWLENRVGGHWPDSGEERTKACAYAVRDLTRVQSRADYDRDPEARVRFDRLVADYRAAGGVR